MSKMMDAANKINGDESIFDLLKDDQYSQIAFNQVVDFICQNADMGDDAEDKKRDYIIREVEVFRRQLIDRCIDNWHKVRNERFVKANPELCENLYGIVREFEVLDSAKWGYDCILSLFRELGKLHEVEDTFGREDIANIINIIGSIVNSIKAGKKDQFYMQYTMLAFDCSRISNAYLNGHFPEDLQNAIKFIIDNIVCEGSTWMSVIKMNNERPNSPFVGFASYVCTAIGNGVKLYE